MGAPAGRPCWRFAAEAVDLAPAADWPAGEAILTAEGLLALSDGTVTMIARMSAQQLLTLAGYCGALALQRGADPSLLPFFKSPSGAKSDA